MASRNKGKKTVVPGALADTDWAWLKARYGEALRAGPGQDWSEKTRITKTGAILGVKRAQDSVRISVQQRTGGGGTATA